MSPLTLARVLKVAGRVASLASLALLSGCSQRANTSGTNLPARTGFEVRVYGSRTALQQFSLQATNMTSRGLFSGYQSLQTDVIPDGPVELEATSGTDVVSRVAIRPHVCATTPGFPEKIAVGWRPFEVYQIFLTDQGTFVKNSDLTRAFVYSCEIESPDGKDGDGATTVFSDEPPLCEQPERALTDVHLDYAGQTLAGQLCSAFHARRAGQEALILQFVFDSVWVQLAYCLASEPVPLPLGLVADDLMPGKCFTGSLIGSSTRVSPGPSRILAGSWRIDELPSAESARTSGELSFSFDFEGQPAELGGHVDLPVQFH